MTTELKNRLSRVIFQRVLNYDFSNSRHTFCPIWFSDFLPFGSFSWPGKDENGNIYDLSITYTNDKVDVLSSTPALPAYKIKLYFGVPPVYIIHLSEFVQIGQQIDRPSLIVLADTSVSANVDGWIDHAVQAYYLIPEQINLTAERKIEIHRRQLKHFKEWMDRAFIFISRLVHRPLFTENDEKRVIVGDFYAIEATLSFKEFII